MIVKAFVRFFLPLCLLLLAYSGMNAAARGSAADPVSAFTLPTHEFFPLCPAAESCISMPAVSGTDNIKGEHFKIYSEEKEEESYNVLASKKPAHGLSTFFRQSSFATQHSPRFNKLHLIIPKTGRYTSLDRCIAFRVFRI